MISKRVKSVIPVSTHNRGSSVVLIVGETAFLSQKLVIITAANLNMMFLRENTKRNNYYTIIIRRLELLSFSLGNDSNHCITNTEQNHQQRLSWLAVDVWWILSACLFVAIVALSLQHPRMWSWSIVLMMRDNRKIRIIPRESMTASLIAD